MHNFPRRFAADGFPFGMVIRRASISVIAG